MAEPFSIAVSALQVAGAGLKLAETLKSYTDSVRKADKQLRPVANHVRLTSDVLKNVGTLLKKEEIRSLYTKELLASTNEALGGCRTAFEDLEKFVSKLVKPSESGRVAMQTTARFTFYFKQKELDVLQAHLERFKSSLDLVLGVLNLANSARTAKDTSIIGEMKLDIKRLIQAEEEAKKKEAALADQPSTMGTTGDKSQVSPTEAGAAAIARTPFFPAVDTRMDGALVSRSREAIDRRDGLDANSTSVAEPPEAVLTYLQECENATARLTTDILRAMSKWQGSQIYQRQCLLPAFEALMKAMNALSRYEGKSSTVATSLPLISTTQSCVSQQVNQEPEGARSGEEGVEQSRRHNSIDRRPRVREASAKDDQDFTQRISCSMVNKPQEEIHERDTYPGSPNEIKVDYAPPSSRLYGLSREVRRSEGVRSYLRNQSADTIPLKHLNGGHRRTFRERTQSPVNGQPYRTSRYTRVSERSPSPPPARPGLPDEDDEAAYSPIAEPGAFQAAKGFAGLSSSAGIKSSPTDKEEIKPPRPARASRQSLPSLKTNQDSIEDNMLSKQLEDGPAFFSPRARDGEDTLPLTVSSRLRQPASEQTKIGSGVREAPTSTGCLQPNDMPTESVDELLRQWTRLEI